MENTALMTLSKEEGLDLYYQRMSSSLGDKERLIEHVAGSRVLDVGCGAGELGAFLNTQGYEAYGIDMAHESVTRSRALGVDARLGYAHETHERFGEGFFDTIVCSSVLHEVFSYGNSPELKGRIKSLEDTLASFHKALAPGGRLLVRDGVSPGEAPARMFVDKPMEVVHFMKDSPFTKGRLDRNIDISHDFYYGSNAFKGSASSLMEFAFTYTWGEPSYAREVNEFYGIFTLSDYTNFFNAHGFSVYDAYSYIQPGYQEHLEGKVRFLDMDFPHTNAIWMMTKN